MKRDGTRADFLKTQWRGYVQPPAELLVSNEWLWGKIASVESKNIQLIGSQESLLLSLSSQQHSLFGSSIPANLLAVGDSVAYHCADQCVYLLSPCTQEFVRDSSGREWQIFLETVRQFFIENDFQHWTTPTLLTSSGIDAHIDFFTAQGVRTERRFALPTSPEFALKKAMAEGETKIFEIRSCFRDDDRSPTHKAEFTMIEWYRAYADKWELLQDFLNLTSYVIRKMKLPIQAPESARKYTIAELFKELFHYELTPQTSLTELHTLLKSKDWDFSPTDDWDDLFFRLYIDGIEPALKKDPNPVVLANFPLTQGSLSRATEDGWSDRFEIYWQGIELANAYQEENNPEKMRDRYNSELQKRTGLQRIPHAVDEEFLQAMKRGFPPSAGIALGLDRLWMILSGKTSI